MPIPILTVKSDQAARSARDAIHEWISGDEARHCILLGEPGAGKTGLLTWAASTINERETSIALWASAKRLHALPAIDLTRVLGLCDPALPADFSAETEDLEVFFLLDGLDELTGAGKDGETVSATLLRRTLESLPSEWRVLASCRTPAFDALRGTIQDSMPCRRASVSGGDHYEGAILRALGMRQNSVTLIQLAPVQSTAASVYLRDADLPGLVIEGLLSDEQWQPLLSSPFLLRLARLALPILVKTGPPTLDRLYGTYVKAALYREKHDLSDAEISGILDDLTKFSNFIDTQRLIYDPELPLRADFLRQQNGVFDFSHYSLWEYFFARHLHSEIVRASAKTLAHVNLVAAYNVNRMLVPMLLHDFAKAEVAVSSARFVTPGEYLAFVKATKWRGLTGYGLHPSRSCKNARVPVSTFQFENGEALAVHDENHHGHGSSPIACAVSWYDAAAFALQRGVWLPTSRKLVELRPSGTHLLWCSDWLDEGFAHIAVYDMETGEVHGLNPDVRLARTALSIVERDKIH